MKAPQETTDKAQIGEGKELHPSCYDWQPIVFTEKCSVMDYHAYWKVKMKEKPTIRIVWNQDGINWDTCKD